ncbi:glycosyltransferase family 1 protein [Jackrogersella minutella]|nr:glycosyltransferase family 1 protein [Jackrogersella minutella]
MAKRTTVLFLTNSELSQSSVNLAAAAALATDESFDVHIGSFKGLAPLVPEGVTFHTLAGTCFKDIVIQKGVDFLPRHAPGIQGAIQSYKETMPLLLAPWDDDDYFTIYDSCVSLIKELNPAAVALDFLFGPGADAVNTLKQRHIYLSPGTYKDHAVHMQPLLQFAWKYPVVSSGFRVPLPLTSILPNIYLIYNLLKYSYFTPRVTGFIKARNERGIQGNLSTKYNMFDFNLFYLTQARPQTDFPLSYIPDNLIGCGPILPPFEPLEKADPELARWIRARPTVIINMGSHITYKGNQINEVLSAIQEIAERHPGIQILWKCPKPSKEEDVPAVDADLFGDRIRIITWLPSTPVACLTASKSVLAYVHHGGSNSFHEAVGAGVPQVVCPVWIDTYDFATRVEMMGVGVRGNDKAAPYVKADEFAAALERVVGGSDEAKRYRDTAKKIAEEAGHVDGGRKVAAQYVKEVALKP